MANLIYNKDPSLAPRAKEPVVFDKIAHHVQTAMQEMRDDPCGDLAFERHCTAIYQLLAKVMDLLATPPRAEPNKALQSDLAAVMGGANGTTQVSQVQEGRPTAPK